LELEAHSSRKEGESLKKADQGMTLLEVVFAITILLIGASFMIQSNLVTFKLRAQSTEYKQMLFYAAGQMDAIIEKKTVLEDVYLPFKSYEVDRFSSPVDDDDVGTHLEKVGVEVSVPGERTVVIYSYRLK